MMHAPFHTSTLVSGQELDKAKEHIRILAQVSKNTWN
jgi:hypothetical protein